MLASPRYAQIISVGRYVPEKVLTNADLEARLGAEFDAWLIENVGIQTRHLMADDETTSDLAAHAARNALEKAGLSPLDLDLIILATDTPDYISPGTSSALQYKLGAKNAFTFDLNNACAAWGTGLDLASRYIATDPDYQHILVVGAYGMSRYLDWSDKRTCTVFGDGAGAVILSAGDKAGFLASATLADGAFHNYMGVFGGGTAETDTKPLLEIRKRFPPDINSQNWPKLVRQLMHKINRPIDSINRIYFTQINYNTIQEVMAELALPMNRTHTIMDKWAYTGSACIPMALADSFAHAAHPNSGDLVIFCASGVGFAMIALAFEWI